MLTKPKVDIETTILSYLAARPSRDVVTAGRQMTTRQWWENERQKYTLVGCSEVQDECQQGDPAVVERRRTFLTEVSLFPVDERILELTELFGPAGSDPETGRSGCDPHCSRSRNGVLVPADVEPPPHRRCAHPAAGRKDSGPAWLLANHHLHARPTHRMSAGGKTKSCGTCTRGGTPTPPPTAMTSAGFLRT